MGNMVFGKCAGPGSNSDELAAAPMARDSPSPELSHTNSGVLEF